MDNDHDGSERSRMVDSPLNDKYLQLAKLEFHYLKRVWRYSFNICIFMVGSVQAPALDGAGPESAQVTINFFNYDEYRLRTRDLD